MTKVKAFRKLIFLLMACINVILFVSVFYLMNYVQQLLDSDAKINLTEIVTQNKDVITSKLMLEVNNLDLIAKQLSERMSKVEDENWESQKSIFLEYAKEQDDSRLCWAKEDGKAVSSAGKEVDISGRNYFRLAMQGRPNISDRAVSRLDGEDIFVISVPLYVQEKIIGSVQKQYTPQEMYEICSVSLFSKQGYMYIINSQGYILISSQQDEYSRESDNYYRMIYLNNPEASKKLETDILNEQAGFMETEIDGKKVFSAYTPIDDIYDWYLISSVATSAVSPNANIVIRLFYFILLAVVIFFAICMIYILFLKNRQHSNLERIAFVDTVTHGDTYTKFILDVQTILKAQPNKQFYIFAFDIDNFKYINNYYGFGFGDNILSNIRNFYAQKLTANERIARVYSDHFVILLENAQEERINTLFQSELQLEDTSVYLSAGLYPISDIKESVNLMVDKANMAAQKIKGLRNKKVEIYSEEFDRQMIRNEHMKRAVEQALIDDEIIPFFQPKVDIGTRELVGAEALARWKTKEGKLVSPGEFIPVCEKTGLIVSIDFAIFEKTLQFIRHNLDKGVHCVPISVNFSRMHLLNKDFLNTLVGKLQEYQVPAKYIELELTESVIFDNSQQIQDFIHQLHDNGLQISMDDFGTGYSSLHMLKDVDIDVLKIDQGFLKDTANSQRQKAIFAAIAQMAEKLDIKVVVEGVETIENVELMKEFRCTIAQGYYYAKPMDKELFGKIYEEGIIC